MERKFRLTRSTDFQRVRRFGKTYAHPLMVLAAAARPEEPEGRVVSLAHVGIVAGRAVGNAVERNRAKRLLRSAIHPHLDALKPGWDMVLIARGPLLAADFTQIQTALLGLLQRARLLQVVDDHRDQ